MSMGQARQARSDGLTIRYGDLGHGEPALLCMPGWCASRVAFDGLARQFAARRRVLSLDWRGHGRSDPSDRDFGTAELVRDALAVIEASGARQVVPLATAHAGWVAMALRRALGAHRIPKLVLVDWIVTAAPPPFLAALSGLQDPAQWQAVRDRLFAMWLEGVDHPAVISFVRDDMGSYPFEMWARAGREISGAYATAGSPLDALSRLDPPPPALHLAAQHAPAPEYPWLHTATLSTRSHFPTLEAPEAMVDPIERFLAGQL